MLACACNLPAPLPRACRFARTTSKGNWFTRFQETRFLVTRNKISSYKKQEKLVWCVVEEGPSLHTHTNGRTVSPQFLPFKELGTHVSESRMRAPQACPLLFLNPPPVPPHCDLCVFRGPTA